MRHCPNMTMSLNRSWRLRYSKETLLMFDRISISRTMRPFQRGIRTTLLPMAMENQQRDWDLEFGPMEPIGGTSTPKDHSKYRQGLVHSHVCLSEITSDHAAILHYVYNKYSDLKGRRDRCDCAPTEEDTRRCFMLPFDREVMRPVLSQIFYFFHRPSSKALCWMMRRCISFSLIT